MIRKEFVTWEMVESFIDQLIDFHKDSNLTGVFGLPRGGLIFAVMISERLNIPMLMAPCEGCLIVDDICDTGESLLHYMKNSSSLDKPLFHTATMYYKENDLGIKPEMYLYNKEDKWVVFPWEEKEDK